LGLFKNSFGGSTQREKKGVGTRAKGQVASTISVEISKERIIGGHSSGPNGGILGKAWDPAGGAKPFAFSL